jgi:hypothetical protein
VGGGICSLYFARALSEKAFASQEEFAALVESERFDSSCKKIFETREGVGKTSP